MRVMIMVSVLWVAMGAAHAGRRTISFELEGWSADGKSAMFTRNVQEDDKMGRVFDYVIVTASESKPLDLTTLDDLAEKTNEDAPPDKITVAACNKAAATLANVIATRKFKGLKVEKNGCTGPMRTVVNGTSDNDGKNNQASWVVKSGSNVHNTPTKREAAAIAAAASITQDTTVDIAASPGDGTLVVVIYSSPQGEVLAYFNKGTLVAKDL